MKYMDMTPEQLREAYTGWRASLYNATEMRYARGTGRALREVEFIENVARKRGVRL